MNEKKCCRLAKLEKSRELNTCADYSTKKDFQMKYRYRSINIIFGSFCIANPNEECCNPVAFIHFCCIRYFSGMLQYYFGCEHAYFIACICWCPCSAIFCALTPFRMTHILFFLSFFVFIFFLNKFGPLKQIIGGPYVFCFWMNALLALRVIKILSPF